ncbi:MAG: T9SS type A sorting domain-containing protein [Balneolales bacterium]|nr:T9SS type A sorting domain-containing protein [Balneolales bacterium]
MKTKAIRCFNTGLLVVIMTISFNMSAYAVLSRVTHDHHVRPVSNSQMEFAQPVGLGNSALLNLEINEEANLMNLQNIDISVDNVFQFGDTDITQITQVVKDETGNTYITGGFTGSFTWGVTTLTSSHGVDMFVAKLDANNQPVWVRMAAGATDIPEEFSLDGGLALTVNNNGSVYVAGTFVKSLYFLDEDGDILDFLTDGRDDENLNFELFVAKYSSNGDLLWVDGGYSGSTGAPNSLAVDRNIAMAIILDEDDFPYVAGAVAGDYLFGEPVNIVGESDFFLASLDTDGTEPFWVSTTGTPNYDYAVSISVDALGYLNVLGIIGEGLMELPDSDVTWNNDTGERDSFFISYDVDGEWYFAAFIGGGDQAVGNDIESTPDGDIFVTGTFKGDVLFPGETDDDDIILTTDLTEGFIAKYDLEGDIIWARKFGNTQRIDANKITIDEDQNVFVLGRFRDYAIFEEGTGNEITLTTNSENDLFIVKYDTDGNFQWVKQIQGSGRQSTDITFRETSQPLLTQPLDLVYSSFNGGELLLSGDFEGSLTLDDIVLNAPTGTLSSTYLNGTAEPRSGFVATYPLGASVKESLEITGQAGWRLMGAPVRGVTVANLAEQNLIQGVSGLPYNDFAPNIYTFDPEAETGNPDNATGAFTAPTNGSAVLSPGSGFIWYMWGPDSNPDIPESKPFPVSIEVGGLEPSRDVELGVLAEGWNLIANPYTEPIGFNQIISADGTPLNTIGYVWNPNEAQNGSYVLTSSGDLSNTLPAWQGAFINLDEATEVVIPRSARTTGGSFLQGEPNNEPELSGQIEFMLESLDDAGEVVTRDRAAILAFHKQATTGWDSWDAEKLTPLSHTYATAAFLGERNGEPVLKAQYSLPYEVKGTYEIPVDIQLQNTGGNFRLSWPVVSNLPAEAKITLLDTQTGQSYDLGYEDYVDFTLQASGRDAAVRSMVFQRPDIKPMGLKSGGQRFVIIVNSMATSTEPAQDLPDVFGLFQNYPNPFNPATKIQYQLPQASDVRLEVFNLQGQLVAVLADGRQNAGVHTVTFDASRLASGIYIYRLRAGSFTQSQKMTLIK